MICLVASGGADLPLHLVRFASRRSAWFDQVLSRSDCSWCASAYFPRVPRRGAISIWNISCKSYNQHGNGPRWFVWCRCGFDRALFNAFGVFLVDQVRVFYSLLNVRLA